MTTVPKAGPSLNRLVNVTLGGDYTPSQGSSGAQPGPMVSGILDSYLSHIWTAFGIKHMIGTWRGPLIRVRRSSDNAQADVGYLSDNSLDVGALLAFVGSDSGWVVKAYDQSGQGNHFVSGGIGTEPRIVNAGTLDAYMGMNLTGSQSRFSSMTLMPGGGTGLAIIINMRARSIAAVSEVVQNSNVGVDGHVSYAFDLNNGYETAHSRGPSSSTGDYVDAVFSNYYITPNTPVTFGLAMVSVIPNPYSGATALTMATNGTGTPVDHRNGTVVGVPTPEALYLGDIPGSGSQSPLDFKNVVVYTDCLDPSTLAVLSGTV